MGRQFALMPNQISVPVNLVSVVDRRQQESQIGLDAGHRHKIHMTAIPGVPGVAEVCLLTPGLVDSDLFPFASSSLGEAQARVVAQMELPIAIQRDHPLPSPSTFRGAGGVAAREPTGECEKQEGQGQTTTYPAKYAST